MRVAVISDIHGNLAALVAVLEDIGRAPPDAILNLGDSFSGPLDPAGVADLLTGLKLPTVRGNHDRCLVEPTDPDWDVDAFARERLGARRLDWVRGMPATQAFEDTLFMCHGTPASDMGNWLDVLPRSGVAYFQPRAEIEAAAAGYDFPVLLCGHSHIARTVRLADGRLLVNPGSVGWQFGFGSPDAHYAIVEKRRDGWAVEQRVIPYDSRAMQKLALDAGFPKFAEMLRTGWPTPYDA